MLDDIDLWTWFVLMLVLYFSAVREEMLSLATRRVFGASLDLDLLGIEIDERTLIPGLAVASSRAKPLAGACPISITASNGLYSFLMLFLISFICFTFLAIL